MATDPDTAVPSLPSDLGDAALHRFLGELPAFDGVSAVGAAEDSAARPLPGEVSAADAAIALTDLTTLEGTDTPDRVRRLCEEAVSPDPDDLTCPSVAAVCVYSDLAGVAVQALRGSGVRVAAVAGSFPSGRAPLPVRVADVRAAVDAGAEEVDVVIDRGAFLDGRYGDVAAAVAAMAEAAGAAHLKAILEVAELPDLAAVRRAAWIALLAGADMVKTSTGKVAGGGGATIPAVAVMLDVARAYEAAAGRPVGVKASGGVRTAEDAARYLALLTHRCGRAWLEPERFRFGASSLLADLVRNRRERTG